MKKMNNKGFTLIEVLAVIAIIAILGLIAVPGVLNSINNSKDESYRIMISNIKTASQTLYEEIDYVKGSIYQYNTNGIKTASLVKITNSSMTVNLQTLVSNGLLTGTASTKEGKKILILINPKDGQNIGSCQIEIKKETNITTGKVNYKITSVSSNSSCPATRDYQ